MTNRLITCTIRLPPENLAAALADMRHVVTTSRAEPGCLAYTYAQDLFEPGLIHVLEIWTDQPALDRHLSSPHLAAWRATWPSLGIHPRGLTIYDASTPRQT